MSPRLDENDDAVLEDGVTVVQGSLKLIYCVIRSAANRCLCMSEIPAILMPGIAL